MRARTMVVSGLGILALLVLLASPAAASTCIGTCGTDVANGDVTAPPVSSTYTYVTTTGGPTGGGTLPGGAPLVSSTNGSTLTTGVFSATAGSTLQYYFNYVTSDGSGYPDYAWVELESSTSIPLVLLFTAQTNPSGNTVPGIDLPPIAAGVTLTPSSTPIFPGSGTQCGNGSCNSPAGGPVWAELGSSSGDCWSLGCGLTGWVESQYTIATAGNYELAFGVSNTNDTNYDSGLAFSGLTIAGTPIPTVPEPSTMALLGLGLGTLVVGRRRKVAR